MLQCESGCPRWTIDVDYLLASTRIKNVFNTHYVHVLTYHTLGIPKFNARFRALNASS